MNIRDPDFGSIILKERDLKSEHVLATQILEGDDEAKCIQYIKLNRMQFDNLLKVVEFDIKNHDAYWGAANCARNRLILTLR